MNKYDRCEACPDEDTEKCDTCGQEPETMTLTYTFVIKDGITVIEGLHKDLDLMAQVAGCELVKSTLESPDEESEKWYKGGKEIE